MTTPATAREQLIVALDCGADEAIRLASALEGTVRWLKVGMTLFYQEGPRIVELLREHDFSLFLDLKLHDIPHQVGGAARALAGLGVQMFTVHAAGGSEMIRAAAQGAKAGAADAGFAVPSVLAVTVLTSMSDAMLEEVGVSDSAASQVLRLATVAMRAGADGIVCSPLEASHVRAVVGPEGLVVTPGVRPSWSAAGDQSRITTPGDALSRGSSHLVVGRPITGADDPVGAAARIIAEMEDGL